MQAQASTHAFDDEIRHVPWSAVLSMSLCAFVLVASEFMPVSLLTPIASDLAITEGQAGQVISVSGIFAILTSLFMSSLVGGLDRKLLQLSLVGLMFVSGFLVAVAPDYRTMMLGRALLGVTIGGCWSMSTAIMIRIVPGAFIPKAIAILQGGSALATAVAAPIGSFLGGLIGWRGAFFCIVPIVLLTLVWQAFSLPALPSEQKRGGGGVLRLIRRLDVATGMGAVALLFMGQFALFTYLRPFLETVANTSVLTLSLIFLVIGVSGLAGTTLVGGAIARSLQGVLIVIPLLMAGIALVLLAVGERTLFAAMLLGAWGFVATPAPVGWFAWLSRTIPEEAEAGGGLMVAIIQLAITLGTTTGGFLYDSLGYQAIFISSAGVLLVAGLLAYLCTLQARSEAARRSHASTDRLDTGSRSAGCPFPEAPCKKENGRKWLEC